MFEICRPTGRFFLCAGLFLGMVVAARGATPTTTTVSDVIYRADGTVAQGTLLISWPAFVSADEQAVSGGQMSMPIGADGSVTVALIPNEGATPSGTYYTVIMKLDGGTTEKEFWSVPANSPVTIAEIRSAVVPQSMAVQMVSKQYVDSQIAGKANDNAVVHSAGGETISGVKEFAISPRIPDPNSGEEAANKEYVDNAIGLVGEGSYVKKVGDAMSGPLVLSGDPASDNQAANRHYVDTEVAGVAGGLAGKESLFNKDQASGYAGLDGSGYVSNSHLGGGATDSSKCLKGDHSWGSCGSGDSTTIRYVTSDYNWRVAPTSPTTLTAGTNTVTVTPCAKGVDPTTTSNYYVYIAGTGTPEAALVTGGTACSSNSLTLTFTVAAWHAAGYTVGSASSGISEASNDARVRPTNPTGSWQTGKVIVPPGEYKAYAPIYIQATNQTVDFTGAFIECYDGTKACIFVGSPTNQNTYQDITLINPKGRPMVASGTNPFIEVNAQATHIIKPLTRAPLSGNTFGYLVQVDDDESFELEGVDPSSGDALRCDATFCGSAVYGPGPFAGNSAVGWIHHSNMSMNCKGNGIEWQTGNTLKVSDSVIQGYPQFAIRGGRRGGYGGIVFDNVYTEVGSCTNPIGNVGSAGAIIQGHTFKFVNDTVSSPSGSFPKFSDTGTTNYHYWIVAHHATYGDSIPLPAGYAKTDGTTAVPVTWFKIAGADSFKVLRMTWDGQPFTRPFPHDTGNYLVGTVVASACMGQLCTFSDTHTAPSSYTSVSATGLGNWYYPLIDYWPGNVVMSASGDSDSPADTGTVYADSIPGSVVAVNNPSMASVFIQDCNPASAHSDAWAPVSLIRKSCQHVQGSQNAYQLGGIFLGNKISPDGGQETQIKGRINFGNFSYGPTDIVTWYDTALGKTLSDPYNRPSNDASDAATGMEDAGTLYSRASTALRSYVGKAADGNPQAEITANQEKFNVPVAFKEQGAPSNPAAGTQVVYAKPGGFCAKDSAGNEKCMGSVGGGGVTVFTGLADVPNSYVSSKYKLARVNGGESALEFLGVPDCSNAATSKLLYNATTGAWSCGTDQTSGGGATAFTALTDVPNSYNAQGGKIVRVNTGATGLEFIGIPDCSNATTSKLLYTASTSTWSCGTDQNSTGNYVALAPSSTQTIHAAGASDIVPLAIQGGAGQSHDLQQWLDNGGNLLASVGPGGAFSIAGPGTYADDAIHVGNGTTGYAEIGLESTASNSIRFKRVTNDFQMSNVGGNFNFYRWNAGTPAYEEVFHAERTSDDVYFQGRIVLGAHEFFGNLMAAPSNPGTGNYVLWVDSTTHKLSCKYGAGTDCAPAGTGGATTFTQLTDVPNSYGGQSGKALRVNAGATGLEFYVPSSDSDTVDGQHASAFALTSHTHAESAITNLVTDLAAKESTANKGAVNGYASLGSDGKVPSAQLPPSSANPPGSDTQVAFNDATEWGASADLVFNKTSKALTVGGTQADIEGSEGSPLVANLTKGRLSFSSPTHRPAYSYNGGTPKDVAFTDDIANTTPPGADTQVIFNDGNQWGASADLTFNKVSGELKSKSHTFTGTGPFAFEGGMGTCSLASSGKGKLCFKSGNNRPAWSYSGASYSDVLLASDKGIANGVASLGSDGKVPATQLPGGSGGPAYTRAGYCVGNNTSTHYYVIGGSSNQCSSSPPTTGAGLLIDVSRTVKNLYLKAGTVASSGHSYAFAVFVNNVASALQCSLSDSVTQCSDTTHEIAVSQFDVLTVQSTTNGVSGENLKDISAYFEVY